MEYGLIGEKLSHSFSKIIHNKLTSYEYDLKEIKPNELEQFMKKADFKAINVTIPYKTDVIQYLDEVDDVANKIGAVNTVVNRNGKLAGYNTDFYGLLALINKEKIDFTNKKVLILGSGGTSKTALCVAKHLCAKEIYRVSRNAKDDFITYNDAITVHFNADIIINTTPCGMYKNIGVSAIDIEQFKNLSAVIDVVYNPLSTHLITTARQKGIKAIGGLYMLIAQAFFAVEIFLDKELNKSIIDEIYLEILKQKQNIVLVGMPSSGKSTIGKLLANELSKQFFDSDIEIEKITNMKIADFIEKFGEAQFREVEAMVIADLALKQSCVIATGGGAVLNQRNTELLKENGKIVFIDRALSDLLVTDDRPLTSSKELLQKKYFERYDIYKQAADLIIKNDTSLEKIIDKIKEGI